MWTQMQSDFAVAQRPPDACNQEDNAGKRESHRRRAHGNAAAPPAPQQAKGNAAQMQQSGCSNKTDAITDDIGSRRKLSSVRRAVEDCERAGYRAPPRPAAAAPRARPSRRARSQTAQPRPRRQVASRQEWPLRPRMPSRSETATGSIQTAGAPRNAPQRPTATIATIWSGPNNGCAKPPMKSELALPVWAIADE